VTALIAFDVYGTLVDPAGMVIPLAKPFGAQAVAAAQLWREKQLEFTFRRALMRRYVDFDVCTAQALSSVSAQLGVPLDEDSRAALLAAYLRLPSFADVKASLETLSRAGHRLVALSNGTGRAIRTLLSSAQIESYFADILSADSVRTFKPDPAVYSLLQAEPGYADRSAWLVSANPFDVIGAKAAGLRAVWVRRDPARTFDPWEFQPDAVIGSLAELPAKLAAN
jgi:2-haloacid dehalogenase